MPTIHGKTYGEWGARWWQWFLSIPDDPPGSHPGTVGMGREADDPEETDCRVGDQGPVLFLAGIGGEFGDVGKASRKCKYPIPKGKTLFLPVVNSTFVNEPGEDATVEEKRVILGDFSATSFSCLLNVEIDGAPAYQLPIGVTQTPTYETEPVFLYPPGTYDEEAVGDGFWIAVAGLSRGDHVLRFAGIICDPTTGEEFFRLETTYHFTVGRKRR